MRKSICAIVLTLALTGCSKRVEPVREASFHPVEPSGYSAFRYGDDQEKIAQYRRKIVLTYKRRAQDALREIGYKP